MGWIKINTCHSSFITAIPHMENKGKMSCFTMYLMFIWYTKFDFHFNICNIVRRVRRGMGGRGMRVIGCAKGTMRDGRVNRMKFWEMDWWRVGMMKVEVQRRWGESQGDGDGSRRVYGQIDGIMIQKQPLYTTKLL